ncbi:MAG: alpha-amlyase [Flavobacterium sp. MedPE-SWcel]|uniref:alpha-amylase family glycosyl hydrolase n=1 Tax=uncultured Flavobacterium sp. TaxID=165435 RepID=UPI000913C455|nr:alpha-amylase family glycosyl hydrolase [uncultured Flavobacterium sp.]OIQ17619.1 MAG: alpha-amlyase [Flavobacterium sp. MedPE-SWcel]
MKKTILLGIILAAFASCKDDKKEETAVITTTEIAGIAPMSDAVMESSVIYEANIRQYSPEGTFAAFTKDIPQLKKLGVKVLWVMPIYPVSMKNRKATGELSVEDIKDPKEREKYLGSYYAISDYTAINPDMGTLEDFQELVKTAHDNDIYVILDWVANHTGWDHEWITEHPEYYYKNADGEVTDPLNPETGESHGWTDVAHLDYTSKELYEPMTKEMLYWVKEQNIDGFRCDVADNVPTAFWEYAIPKLRDVKPIFMLAESEKDYLLKDNLFDMGYGWEAHHIMNDIAKGNKSVRDWDNYITKKDSVFEADDILMYFTSNHDENSWNGTEYERMGDAAETFAALTYMIEGMPLIYSGQEYDFDRRLKFFEKDSITKEKKKMYAVYEKFALLKNNNTALNGGKDAASYTRIATSDDTNIYAISREKDESKVWYIANLSDSGRTITLPIEGEFTNYMTGEKITLAKNQMHELKAWQYYILTK